MYHEANARIMPNRRRGLGVFGVETGHFARENGFSGKGWLFLNQQTEANLHSVTEANGELRYDALYRIRPGYAIRAFMDEYLVIPVGAPGAEDSKMAVLSPVAEFIWEQLQEPRPVSALLRAVTDEFEVDAEEAEKDIVEFLLELKKQHFLLMEDEKNETP